MPIIYQITTPVAAAAYLVILSAAIIRVYHRPHDGALLIRLIGVTIAVATPALLFLLLWLLPVEGVHGSESPVGRFWLGLVDYTFIVAQLSITLGILLFAVGELVSALRQRRAAPGASDEASEAAQRDTTTPPPGQT